MDHMPGDISGDGVIDFDDAVMLLQYHAQLISEDDICVGAADVNGDKKENTKDVTCLLQYIMDWDVEIY